MDIDALTDDDRKQLAKDLAAELDTGLYGNRAVLSRRQLLSIAGGSAGVAGLTALGVDPATAQSAAGQVGTSSSPEDVFAYDLDVQNGATFNGNDLTGVGSLSTESIGSNYHYAEGYSGTDRETRLSNAISAASDGDTIYLEKGTYSSDLTTNKTLKIVGSGGVETSVIDTGTTWTFNDRVWIECVRCIGIAPNLQINANFSVLDLPVHGTTGDYAIQIAGDNVRVSSGSCSLLFESGTSGGLVDSSQGVNVTDNGTNTVGDNV